MNEQDVLVLSVTPYDFKDESTGKRVQGSTCWLLPLKSTDQYTNGVKPVKYSLTSDVESYFNGVQLPAYATMSFDFDFSRNRVKPAGFSSVHELELGVL